MWHIWLLIFKTNNLNYHLKFCIVFNGTKERKHKKNMTKMYIENKIYLWTLSVRKICNSNKVNLIAYKKLFVFTPLEFIRKLLKKYFMCVETIKFLSKLIKIARRKENMISKCCLPKPNFIENIFVLKIFVLDDFIWFDARFDMKKILLILIHQLN